MQFSDIYKKGYGIPETTDLIVGGFGVDIKGKRAYSHAEDGTIFQIGLDEEQINDLLVNQVGLTPIGGIVMYSGQLSNLPANWAICDGSDGTPNLTDRFVLGTNVQSSINNTGGSADAVVVSHTHTQAAHSHTGSTSGGNHDHTETRRPLTSPINQYNGGPFALPDGGTDTQNTGGTGAHSHTLNVDNSTPTINSSGVSGTNANLPPYVKLAYIMRKS